MDVSNMKIGLYNFLIVGIMALLFIVLMKMLTTKYPIKGLTEVVHAA